MKVGNYKIGKYHAILKKVFEDGTYNYETDFVTEWEGDIVTQNVKVFQMPQDDEVKL